MQYYKRNTLAIIIIYNEQCARRLPINCNESNVYQFDVEIARQKCMTACAAYHMTSLNTEYQETL